MTKIIQQNLPPCEKLLDFHSVRAICGNLSRSTIWRMEKENKFPKSINLGPRRRAWLLSDILKWIEDKK